MGLDKTTWRIQETREEPQIKQDKQRGTGGRNGIEQDLEETIPEMEELEKTVSQNQVHRESPFLSYLRKSSFS